MPLAHHVGLVVEAAGHRDVGDATGERRNSRQACSNSAVRTPRSMPLLVPSRVAQAKPQTIRNTDQFSSLILKTHASSAASMRGWSETRRNGRVSAVSVAPDAKLLCVLTASTFARRLLRRLTATRSRRRMNALGRSIHVRGKGCAHDHDRFAHRDPSSSFSLVRTQARERGSACPARPIRTPPSGSI